jgi:hypothetical protein
MSGGAGVLESGRGVVGAETVRLLDAELQAASAGDGDVRAGRPAYQ